MERRTLLLTSWMFPLKIITWQGAAKMKYEGTVDVMAEYEDEISSPSVTWKIPAVVRLRKNTVGRKSKVRFSRINVYTRDRFTCQYCGRKFLSDQRMLSYDHVVPRCEGGRTVFTNIVTACKPCNSRKDNKSCDEAGMWPMRTPVHPKTLPMTGPRIDRERVPSEWLPFLPEPA
jgi:5-methylcytosine-specific restriction endonuclease McrA